MIIQSKSGTNLVNSLRYVRYHQTLSDELPDPWGSHVTRRLGTFTHLLTVLSSVRSQSQFWVFYSACNTFQI